MTLKIREFIPDDAEGISRVSLLCADAGQSGEHLHEYKELPGLIYAIPYLKLPTTWGFVLENETTKEIVGYTCGATDSRVFEAYGHEHWWPALKAQFPEECATKPADIHHIRLLQTRRAPDGNVAFSPAHMHINIVKQYQKQGWGRKLFAAAVEHVKGEGLDRVFLGVDPRNENGKQFYEHIGFRQIEGEAGYWLGLRFEDFQKTSG